MEMLKAIVYVLTVVIDVALIVVLVKHWNK